MQYRDHIFRDDNPAYNPERIETGIKKVALVYSIKPASNIHHVCVTKYYRRKDAISTEGDTSEPSLVSESSVFSGTEAECADYIAKFRPENELQRREHSVVWMDTKIHSEYCKVVGIPDDDGKNHFTEMIDD